MKTLLSVIAMLAFAWIFLNSEYSPWRISASSPSRTEGDSVSKMKTLVSAFPNVVHFLAGWGDEKELETENLYDVKYNVKKTDSLSAPIVGYIDFSHDLAGEAVQYEIVYHWDDGQWRFENLTCLNTDVNQPIFEERMLESPEIKSFIKHGKVDQQKVSSEIEAMARAEKRTMESAPAAAAPNAAPTPWQPSVHDLDRPAYQ